MRRSQNEITGDFISYDMGREVAEVLGAPPGQKPPAGSRVKVTIIPPKKEGEAPAKPQPGLQLKPDTTSPQ